MMMETPLELLWDYFLLKKHFEGIVGSYKKRLERPERELGLAF